MKRANVIFLALFIEFIRFDADFLPQLGNFSNSFMCLSRENISNIFLMYFLSYKNSICFSPRPSMLKALRDTKCF